MIRTYDSIAALRAEAVEHDSWNKMWTASALDNETFAQLLARSDLGHTALVPEAEAMIARISTGIETPCRVWERAPAGAFPCVPEAIAGLPTAMRRQAHTADAHQPIAIYVRPNAHADVDGPTLRRRGIAILALVLALSRVRPVSLHYLFIGDGRDREGTTTLCARIETAPLDLASAAYVLTSAAFYRVLCMGVAARLNRFYGLTLQSDDTGRRICEQLTPDNSRTLYIGIARRSDPLLADPIAWINATIARFVGQQQKDFAA